jgi:hypothetical protein
MLFFLLLSLLSTFPAAASDSVPDPVAVWDGADLFPDGAALARKVDLHLVMLKESGWSQDQIKQHVKDAAKVFSQCGLRLGKVDLRVVPGPNGLTDFEIGVVSTAPNSLRALAQKFQQLPRPLAFFVHDFYYPDFKADGSGTPFSLADFPDSPDTPRPPEVQNTVWMPVSVNAPDYYESHCKSTSYAVFAHELTHLLTGEGMHNNDDDPNILSLCILGKRNNVITPKQCSEIQSSSLLSK